MNEEWLFGIEEEGITGFLSEYGLEIIGRMDASALENRFFQDNQGNIIAKVNGTHCLIKAIKK